jgi:hypothetical protein
MIRYWILFSIALFYLFSQSQQDLLADALIDGVAIRALENSLYKDEQSLNFMGGLYPFDPYYQGFFFQMDYLVPISLNSAWRILKIAYVYTVDTSLRTTLADSYSLTPVVIDRVRMLVSTEFVYYFMHGKYLMFNHWLKYFKFGFVLGGGLFQTTLLSGFSVNSGFRFEAFSNGPLLLSFEIIDHFSIKSRVHTIVFLIGTGIKF